MFPNNKIYAFVGTCQVSLQKIFLTIQFMYDTSLEHIDKCRDKKRKRENDERIEVKLE